MSRDQMKEFSLADVLSAITGRLFTPVERLYLIYNWMTGDNLFTHQLPRAFKECQPWLERWFPELKGLDVGDVTAANWQVKLKGFEGRFGKTRMVPRVPRDDHPIKDPIEELCEMVGSEKVIVLKPEVDQ